MGMDLQVSLAAVRAAKGIRQFQKADKALSNDNPDSAVNHLEKGLENFGSALSHLEKAEEDAYVKAGSEIDKGNQELSKSIDKFADGNLDSARSHYEKALDRYDEALELLGNT